MRSFVRVKGGHLSRKKGRGDRKCKGGGNGGAKVDINQVSIMEKKNLNTHEAKTACTFPVTTRTKIYWVKSPQTFSLKKSAYGTLTKGTTGKIGKKGRGILHQQCGIINQVGKGGEASSRFNKKKWAGRSNQKEEKKCNVVGRGEVDHEKWGGFAYFPRQRWGD